MKAAHVRCHGMLCMIRFGFQRRATTAVAALLPAQDCSLEPNMSFRHEQVNLTAVFSPEVSIVVEKYLPYPGNLNSEMLGGSKNAHLDDMQPVNKSH